MENRNEKSPFQDKTEEFRFQERLKKKIKKTKKRIRKLKKKEKELWNSNREKEKKKRKKLQKKLKGYERNCVNFSRAAKMENDNLRMQLWEEQYRNKLWQALYLIQSKDGQKELTKYLVRDVTNLPKLPSSDLDDLNTIFLKEEDSDHGKEL